MSATTVAPQLCCRINELNRSNKTHRILHAPISKKSRFSATSIAPTAHYERVLQRKCGIPFDDQIVTVDYETTCVDVFREGRCKTTTCSPASTYICKAGAQQNDAKLTPKKEIHNPLANSYQLRANSFPSISRRRLRSCRRAGFRSRGNGRCHLARRRGCSLQLSNPGSHLGLESVLTQRPLIIGQRLHMIARLIAQPTQRRQCPGIVRVDGERIHELGLRLLGLVRFFQQSSQLDLWLRRLRTVAGPMVEQVECLLLAIRFRQQHRQAAITLSMVRVALEALVVQVLGLLEIVRPVVQRARFVERRRQVVIAFRRFRVLSDGLLEPVRRLLVVALLIQPNPLDVRRLRLDVAATTRRRQANHDRRRHPDGRVCLWLAGFGRVRRHGHNSQRGFAQRKGRRRFIRRRIGGGGYQPR